MVVALIGRLSGVHDKVPIPAQGGILVGIVDAGYYLFWIQKSIECISNNKECAYDGFVGCMKFPDCHVTISGLLI